MLASNATHLARLLKQQNYPGVEGGRQALLAERAAVLINRRPAGPYRQAEYKGLPISVAGLAPGRGRNFWKRPASTSAA